MTVDPARSSTTPTSHTLSGDHLLPSDTHGPTTQALFSALTDAPHAFLQPSSELHSAALELAKKYIDPLALSVSELQFHRQRDGRLKRKRGEAAGPTGNRTLKMRKLHIDGLDVEQVWGQVRIILKATMEEFERVKPILEVPQADNAQTRFPDDSRPLQSLGEGSHAHSTDHGSVVDGSEWEGSVMSEDDEEPARAVETNGGTISNGVHKEGREGRSTVEKGKDLASAYEGFSGSDELDDEENGNFADTDADEAENLRESESVNTSNGDDEATSATVAEDPTGLNDGFFSIDEFNKQSQFLEQQDTAGESFNWGGSDDESVDWHLDPMSMPEVPAKSLGNKRHYDQDKEDDDGPTFGDMDLNALEGESEEEDDVGEDGFIEESTTHLLEKENTNDIRYEDFFAPPSRRVKHTARRSEVSKTSDVQKAKIKRQKARVGEDDIQRTMEAVRRDLFEDELSAEEEEDSNRGDPTAKPPDSRGQQSTHERRQAKLADEIRRLELANVAKKEWTLAGEARAADRPINSLLEEDLEFERTGKPVPVITAEVSESIEEMIKRRIIAQEFDELIRRRPDQIMDNSDVRRGRFELDDNKAQQSLAELYEEEHMRLIDPEGHKDKRSEKLRKEHDDIEKLWTDVCGKLDALSNWHYKPKPPKPTISIIADVPTIAMEDSRPTATVGSGGDLSRNSMLAPQEIYAPSTEAAGAGEVVPKSGVPVARQEMSRDEKVKRRRRDKERLKKSLAGKEVRGSRGKGMERGSVLGALRKGGVKVIGKKGEIRDVQGREMKERPRPNGAGSFKL